MLSVCAWVLGAGCIPSPEYPSSPQWNAAQHRFVNPPGWPSRVGGVDVLKWWMAGRPPMTPGFRPPFRVNDGLELRANHSRTSVTWIGHATTLVQLGGVNILTDPIFSDGIMGVIQRRAPPGVLLNRLPHIDVVVISHNHPDHLDAPTVDALPADTHYIVGLGGAPWFAARGRHQVTELDWWQSTEVEVRGQHLRITMVPAQHWSQRAGVNRNRVLWGGYVFEMSGHERFYFAGDTGFPAAFAEIGRRFPSLDFAIMPIGAYEPRWFMHPQHLAPDETAVAFGQLGAKTLVPMHWGTFHLSDEPMAEPPAALYRAMGPRANQILFLPVGGSWFGP